MKKQDQDKDTRTFESDTDSIPVSWNNYWNLDALQINLDRYTNIEVTYQNTTYRVDIKKFLSVFGQIIKIVSPNK